MKARLFALFLLPLSAAAADQAPLAAELSCQPELGSGRLICRVDYRSTSAGRIVWADALVTAAPASLRPLRARALATVEGDGESARAGLALVPSADGGGKITVRARAVICGKAGTAEAGDCRPSERELDAELSLP